MRKPNITDGEWWKEGTLIKANCVTVCAIYDMRDDSLGDTQEANARFIAAAPKMAEALEDCLRSLERMPETEGAYKWTCIGQAKSALIAAGYEF